jgi:tRNA uridine 5-carboxymethylaminomethyl modification enzyme
MMTSRAEYRLLLRQDNADMRLMPVGHEIGLVSDAEFAAFEAKKKAVENEIERIKSTNVAPDSEVNEFLEKYSSTPLKSGASLGELLKRPEITYAALTEIDPARPEGIRRDIAEQVEISVKYEGYIKRQAQQAEQFKRLENRLIPSDTDYSSVSNLQTEARQKLAKVRPESIGRASRISGVTPSDIAALLIYMEQKNRSEREK